MRLCEIRKEYSNNTRRIYLIVDKGNFCLGSIPSIAFIEI